MSIITLKGINKVYRTKEIETLALENVNMDVEKGEFLSVMGPSGCGKSTLLNMIGLLDEPTSGTVMLNGINTDGMRDRELAVFRNKMIGFIFQSFHLINSLNVMDNVEIPLIYRRVPAAERKQRVAIARAIVCNPEIILADEPTGNLDSKMGGEIMEILHKLNKEERRTIVMVTHNEEQAKQTSRTLRFFDGRQIQ